MVIYIPWILEQLGHNYHPGQTKNQPKLDAEQSLDSTRSTRLPNHHFSVASDNGLAHASDRPTLWRKIR